MFVHYLPLICEHTNIPIDWCFCTLCFTECVQQFYCLDVVDQCVRSTGYLVVTFNLLKCFEMLRWQREHISVCVCVCVCVCVSMCVCVCVCACVCVCE